MQSIDLNFCVVTTLSYRLLMQCFPILAVVIEICQINVLYVKQKMSWPTLALQSLTVYPENKKKIYMIHIISLVMQSGRAHCETEFVSFFLIIVIVVINKCHVLSPFLEAQQQ